MSISYRRVTHVNWKKSDSTDKNDICSHWNLDYMPAEDVGKAREEGLEAIERMAKDPVNWP
jgi:hypothetical protein